MNKGLLLIFAIFAVLTTSQAGTQSEELRYQEGSSCRLSNYGKNCTWSDYAPWGPGTIFDNVAYWHDVGCGLFLHEDNTQGQADAHRDVDEAGVHAVLPHVLVILTQVGEGIARQGDAVELLEWRRSKGWW